MERISTYPPSKSHGKAKPQHSLQHNLFCFLLLCSASMLLVSIFVVPVSNDDLAIVDFVSLGEIQEDEPKNGGSTPMNLDLDHQQPLYHIKVNREATMDNETKVQTQPQSSLRGREASSSFYSFLQSEGCLPSFQCTLCLDRGNACQDCRHVCNCYCEHLCQVESYEKVKNIYEYRRIPETNLGQHHKNKDNKKRLIPQIVHQTWKEHITKELYPKKSLLQSSWKQEGWQHRFYTDDDVVEFLKSHFPPPVLEAYNTLIPGAFKADLFRYCVLFIYGGVYADYDILCETDLNRAIDPEVGFFAPIDLDRCLWNGLIGSAPGHPFMAAAIETAVNHVRNRYTAVDIMNSLCQEGNVVEDYQERHEALFLTGPCLLGNVVNQVLGRPPQTIYDDREISNTNLQAMGIQGDLQLLEYKQSHFLGGDRFILHSKNLLVAGTTFSQAKDDVEIRAPGAPHYASLELTKGDKVWGSYDLYQDMIGVNEDIQLVLATSES